PRTSEEEILAHIWERVLQVEQVGIHDNFFALGGDSIRSIQVLALARARGLDATLAQLFTLQTIAGIVAELRQAGQCQKEMPSGAPFSLVSAHDRPRLPADLEDAYPLTMLQAGMFFHSAYSLESAMYHNVSSYHLQASLDFSTFQRTWRQVVARHPILRTSFDLESYSQPLQLVHRQVETDIPYEDLSNLAPAEQDACIADLLEQEKAHRFVWEHAPLWRLQVHRRGEQTFQVTLTEHHAILDGWSVASLFTELFTRYLTLLDDPQASLEPPLATHFRAFIALEQAALTSTEAVAFWTHYLRDSNWLPLPRWTDAQQASIQATQRLIDVPISPQISQGLHQLARAAAVPLKSVLLASHLNVLRVLSGQTDVLTGLVTNGRSEMTDGEQVLGLFLNTLPYRARLGGGSWLDLVRGVFEGERAILPWRRYPLARIQHEQGGPALFETIFNYNHFHVYERLGEVSHLRVLGAESFAQTNFTLAADFSLTLITGQVRLQLECNDGQISSEQLDAIGGYYVRTLSAMAVSPTARYELCSLLSERAQQQFREWNATTREFPERCLHELFAEQVARTPEAIALVCEDAHLSYQELNARANRLAHYLLTLGVGPEVLVGICLEHSVEQLVGLLAVLKAGGAYVPLDPSYPAERLAFMLQEAHASIILTRKSLMSNLPTFPARVICLDTAWGPLVLANAENPVSEVTPENLAYVIYTSGSTGQPKGVMVPHRGLVNYLCWSVERYTGARGGPSLVHSPLSFDLTVTGLFAPLLCGNAVHLHLAHQGIEALSATLLFGNSWGLVKLTPAHLALFAASLSEQALTSRIQTMIVGGEQLFGEVLLPWQKGDPATVFINEYGPTEATVGCCVYQLSAAEQVVGAIPIGRPIANTQLYILDQALQPVGTGTIGELFIGGAGIARGYMQRPDLTAERFLPHPLSALPGQRLYRTGDLARYRQDGSIEFVGRQDDQIKLRGYRVEPGEIETLLRQYPHVQDAAVVAREDRSGQKRLVAYLVPRVAQTLSLDDLRGYLQARLPPYMLPVAFVEMQSLPLTSNGKLECDALPEPAALDVGARTAYVAPQTHLEQTIAAAWRAVLQIERVGVADNFFDLGGHSLLLLSLQNRLRSALERDISIIELFEHPTISALAQHIQQERSPVASVQESFERAARRRGSASRRRQRPRLAEAGAEEDTRDE
ncbi:MAG TPA: amino acid adenylation domain-containing protein, partial [Ktedonobacteraceae bacterium]